MDKKRGWLNPLAKLSENINDPEGGLQFSYQVTQKRRLFDSLAAMVRAGIDITAALDSLKRENRSQYETNLINQMTTDLHDGTPIWKTLDKFELVPPQLLALIRTGEESGTLPQNIRAVQRQMVKNKQFTARLRSASLYPAFVFVLLLVVTTVVMVFVLPRLSDVYSSFGNDLPWYTQALISLGEFMEQYGLIVVPWIIIVIILAVYFAFFNKKYKWIGERIMFNAPLIGKLVIELQVARMGQMMSNLTSGGITIDKALDLLQETTENHIYRKFYRDIKEELIQGHTLGYAFQKIPRSAKILPLIAQQMIISGEATGELTEAFQHVGDEFEQRTETSAKDFGTVFEPILIVGVWIGVAIVAFAVIIPLYSVVGNFDAITNPTTSDSNDLSASGVIDFGGATSAESEEGEESLEELFNNEKDDLESLDGAVSSSSSSSSEEADTNTDSDPVEDEFQGADIDFSNN